LIADNYRHSKRPAARWVGQPWGGTWSASARDCGTKPRGRVQCDLPAPDTFVRGPRADQPAVVAGLSMPYSNDPIEGANTKVKLLKRQMYGRAGFPVLRQRILLS
jgi:hypothetical protein